MLNGYIDVDVKQVAVVLYSPLNLDFVVTQFLLFPLLRSTKQVSRLVTLGFLWLTPKGARRRPVFALQTYCKQILQILPTGRLEMNSWKVYRGNKNNNELNESLVCYSSGTVPY